jgi:DNA-binding CsgD family transcriptional regulator
MLFDVLYFRSLVGGGRCPVNTRIELTKQEKVVLSLIARGWRTIKIAQELYLSPRTVETHLAHIYTKLDVSSRTEAAVYAVRANLTGDREIRKNPEDALRNYPYAEGIEFSQSTRTPSRKRMA